MKTVRKSINFSPILADEILQRARENHRSFSAQVVHDMRVVIERKKQAKSRILHIEPEPFIKYQPSIEDNTDE